MTARLVTKLSNLPMNLPLRMALFDGGMESFRVELDAPYGVVVPDHLVTGRVVVQLRERIKARSITCHIVGKAKTSWTVYETKKSTNNGVLNTGVHTNTRQSVPYSAEVVYVDLQLNVWQAMGVEPVLVAGLHVFPFAFTLPIHCPPSFEGTIGFIRYSCKAKIDRPWKFDDTTRHSFTVLPHFDLNSIYYASAPAIRQVSKNIGVLCFKHGRMSAKVILPKSGFVPGENLVIRIEIANSTKKVVTRVESSLIEITTYTARRHHLLIDPQQISVLRHVGVEKKQESRQVLHNSDEFRVESLSEAVFERGITIPPIVPSFNICPIIQVDYKLKVKIVAKSTLGNTLAADIPVLIGTIPIMSTNNIPNGGMPMPNTVPQMPQPPQNPNILARNTQQQDFLVPPQPSAPDSPFPNGPPPSYAESVFGKGTLQEDSNDKTIGFAPKYVFYSHF